MKKALLDAGIGKDIYGSFNDGVLQPYFSVIAKGAKTSQKEEFISVIRKVLKDIADNGIDKKAILAGSITWNSDTVRQISAPIQRV